MIVDLMVEKEVLSIKDIENFLKTKNNIKYWKILKVLI
jgi:hypothetical protein